MLATPSSGPAVLTEKCADCPVYNQATLKKLGVNMAQWDYLVALAGNPNTGKSTIFNALTGLHQHTGNWPGKTVSRAEGGYSYADKRYKIIDLPGTYSLMATSTDEEVARDFILFGQPDVTIVVVDASRLERNLNLALQVMEITPRVVIALNLIDEAKRHGLKVDERSLSRDLGVPVIPMAARQRLGVPELLGAIADVASGRYITRPRHVEQRDAALEAALQPLMQRVIALYPHLPNARWVALRLLDGDASIINALREGTLGDMKQSKAPLEVAFA